VVFAAVPDRPNIKVSRARARASEPPPRMTIELNAKPL